MVAVHVALYGCVLGCSEDNLKGSACLVTFKGTFPLASVFPSTLTATDTEVDASALTLGRRIGAALAISEKVTMVSIKNATSSEVDVASSAM